jgi:hypothetical protein
MKNGTYEILERKNESVTGVWNDALPNVFLLVVSCTRSEFLLAPRCIIFFFILFFCLVLLPSWP